VGTTCQGGSAKHKFKRPHHDQYSTPHGCLLTFMCAFTSLTTCPLRATSWWLLMATCTCNSRTHMQVCTWLQTAERWTGCRVWGGCWAQIQPHIRWRHKSVCWIPGAHCPDVWKVPALLWCSQFSSQSFVVPRIAVCLAYYLGSAKMLRSTSKTPLTLMPRIACSSIPS